jgi:hypothetical protein
VDVWTEGWSQNCTQELGVVVHIIIPATQRYR